MKAIRVLNDFLQFWSAAVSAVFDAWNIRALACSKVAKGRIKAVVLVMIFAVMTHASRADESSLKFLRLLQDNGYGDMAVEYLQVLQSRSQVPKEIADTWDLEMSKSLQLAATLAFDSAEYDRLMDQSQAHLSKFLKEKPEHPQAVAAMALMSEFPIKRALQLIRSAKTTENQEQRTAMLAEARQSLAELREKFQQGVEKFAVVLADRTPRPKKSGDSDARQDAESNIREASFQIALIDYYLAQSYLDPKSQEYRDGLTKAAKAFDAIYQANRTNTTGIFAHMWHGKATEELGDWETALDIYDEVLACAPDPTKKESDPEAASLFTQVEHSRLQILAKRNQKLFLSEAADWLKDYQGLKQTEGYQAIALQLAKVQFANAQDAKSGEKNKRLAEVLKTAAEMSKIRSSSQKDFVLLRFEILKASGRGKSEPTTFDEAAGLAEAAAAGQQWEEALAGYTNALNLAQKDGISDSARLSSVEDGMANAQLMVARNLFNKGKTQESLDAVKAILNKNKEGDLAAQASSLAVAAALSLYIGAADADKPAALEQLTKIAKFTEEHWPDRPEADDARMARGQAKLVVGQIDEAMEIFERVNPRSERYPVAASLAGQNYWRRYLAEKAKPEGERNQEQMAADRKKAVERLRMSAAVARKQADAGKLPKSLFEAQLLLGEICLEGNQMEEAVAIYQPLVDAIRAERPKTLDHTTLRIFLGAVRAYAALNDLERASQVGAVLIDLGPDTPQVNNALIEFLKLLNMERKKADAVVTGLDDGRANLADVEAAKRKLGSVQTLLGSVAGKLASRQELSPAGMVLVADVLGTIGMTAEASQQYQKILARTESDPEFAKIATKAMARVRSQLVGVLRQQGQYEEALKQVDKLIEENPKALEPRMEKGRILEAWSEKDARHYPDAVSHWSNLRNALQQIRGKKPPEYYEVMYNVAECLVRDAQASKDKAASLEKAKQAEQVLKAALTLSPNLNGPDMVARYQSLLNKVIVMQGRKPADPQATAPQKPVGGSSAAPVQDAK